MEDEKLRIINRPHSIFNSSSNNFDNSQLTFTENIYFFDNKQINSFMITDNINLLVSLYNCENSHPEISSFDISVQKCKINKYLV